MNVGSCSSKRCHGYGRVECSSFESHVFINQVRVARKYTCVTCNNTVTISRTAKYNDTVGFLELSII